MHILTNYTWDSKSLLSLILVGLPGLEARLVLRRNCSLHSRLSYRLSIEPLTPDDTADYIRMRLGAVGCDNEAIAMLHEATLGSLRDIDCVTTRHCVGLRARSASSWNATSSAAILSPRIFAPKPVKDRRRTESFGEQRLDSLLEAHQARLLLVRHGGWRVAQDRLLELLERRNRLHQARQHPCAVSASR